MSETNKSPGRNPPSPSSRAEMVSVPRVNLQMVRSKSGLPSAAASAQGMTPLFVLTALRRWWMAALPVSLLLAGVAGLVVYLLYDPAYEAAAWFKIEEHRPFLAFETKDEGRSRLFFQTQIETIRSPLVLGPVIKRPEIARMPELARRPDKVAWLIKQIKVTSVGESELFKILYSAPDPNNAANVVNAVTEAYFKLIDQTDGERNQRVIGLLEQEKDKRSKEVLRLRDNLRALAKEVTGKDPFVGKSELDGLQRHPLADLENRLVAAQVERTVLEARIKAGEEELATGKKPDSAAAGSESGALSPQEKAMRDALVDKSIEDNAEVHRLKAIIADKRTTLNDTEQKLAKGRNSPIYRRLAEEIRSDEKSLGELRRELKPLVRRETELAVVARRSDAGSSQALRWMDELAKLRSDLGACRAIEKMLNDRYDQQRKNVAQSSGDAVELAFKQDELTRAERVFELIAQRALELQTERSAPARVALMQAAEPPGSPSEFPYIKMLFAVLAALCSPFALAVFWERVMGRVGDSQSFELQSNLAVLGEVTRLPVRAAMPRGSARVRIGYDIRLFEESIDSLRTSLMLSEDLAGMRVLAVTSAANQEGKTSVAAQLAVSFARATGESVLLIDGDMRSPSIHEVFQVPLEPGLAKVLADECSLEEAIVASSSKHVHLLPAGRLAVSPHKLLGNGHWKSMLAQIPASYRYVVIDTPPVLAASEALVLAKAADASLVCVMRDVSRLDQVRKAIERLVAAGSRPVGAVLNGVPTRRYASRYGDYAYADKADKAEQ